MFTQEEELILKEMINELKTRMKLNAKRLEFATPVREANNLAREESEKLYRADLTILEADKIAADTAIKERFA